MSAQTQEVPANDAGRPDASGHTSDTSGVMLPIVHMSVDATLETKLGGHRLRISVDGTTVESPPIEHLVFYAGLAVLAGVGLVEWPVALALGVGHALIDITRRPGLQALGELLEET
jgi:hypothetical protein